MNNEIKSILNTIENNGYEAYVIGGFVRDHLLGIKSTDIDIATNALPKDLKKIFKNYNAKVSLYGAFKILTDQYHFDITTYRKELSYSNRRPDKIEYVNNLLEDINRRDFTINTICMNSKGEILDELKGINDLKSKTIKCVGDPNIKLKEDPLRILRALRFAITLDFKLDSQLLKAIKKNIKLVKTLSYTRQKEELDRILVNDNAIKGLKILKNLGILKELKIRYHQVIAVDDLCGMYAQLDIDANYPFTKEEKDNIDKLKTIIKGKKINNIVIYNYGLYLSSVAAKILNINPLKVAEMAHKLPIKSIKELNITVSEIITILNIKPSKIIKTIQNDLIINILNGKLINDKDQIICYIINNRKKWLKNG